jgi:hypothetical protein
MQDSLFSNFAPMLRDMTDAAIVEETERPRRLLLDSSQVRGRRIDIAYAPFDHVNLAAKVVVVGLTPGRQQMRNALLQASRSLRSGRSDHDAAAAAKVFASFSGPMRANLVAMLDSIEVNDVLGLPSTSSLWNGDAHHVHFTSALKYPVFIDGKNYSGTPPIRSTPLLWQYLKRWFALPSTQLRIAELRPGPDSGLIGITFAPGKKGPSLYGAHHDRDLDADLDVIAAWGAAAVVTLVEEPELHELQIWDLEKEVRRRFMEWHHLPIRDVSVPDAAFERSWLADAARLQALIDGGANVLIHCRGGLGRTGNDRRAAARREGCRS